LIPLNGMQDATFQKKVSLDKDDFVATAEAIRAKL